MRMQEPITIEQIGVLKHAGDGECHVRSRPWFDILTGKAFLIIYRTKPFDAIKFTNEKRLRNICV